MLSEDQVLEALSKVNDPELHRSLTELNMVRAVEIHEGVVDVTIALTIPTCPLKNKIEADVTSAVMALPDVKKVNVHMTAMTDEERKAIFGEPDQGSASSYNHVKYIIPVMSGKGGVGKSLVTSLLATALAKKGYRVGILDADITGPSIPKLFGLRGPVDGGPIGLLPLKSKLGVKVMSINLVLDEEDRPVIWRGPLIAKAITQLWGDVMWGELDYLLVDLPPGTSDASLTTLQSLPACGIVMVTTPQSLASIIVRKSVHMAKAVGTPIIGVVENMAYFKCPDTGNKHYIFGPSHAEEVAKSSNAPILAQIPIDPYVAGLCDGGDVELVDLEETPKMLENFIQAIEKISK